MLSKNHSTISITPNNILFIVCQCVKTINAKLYRDKSTLRTLTLKHSVYCEGSISIRTFLLLSVQKLITLTIKISDTSSFADVLNQYLSYTSALTEVSNKGLFYTPAKEEILNKGLFYTPSKEGVLN